MTFLTLRCEFDAYSVQRDIHVLGGTQRASDSVKQDRKRLQITSCAFFVHNVQTITAFLYT